MDGALGSLAAALQPRLKGARGPPPSVPHIAAAILIARDSYGIRAACREVPGVAEGGRTAHNVTLLAERVRPLLDQVI